MSVMKVTEFELGSVSYRMPNVVERSKLWALLGLSFQREKMEEFAGQSEFVLVAKLVEHLSFLITSIDCEKDGKKIGTWDEAIEVPEFAAPLTLIAFEVLGFVTQMPGFDSLNKKKMSGTTNQTLAKSVRKKASASKGKMRK